MNTRILPPYFDYKSRIAYSEIEHVNNNKDIKHSAIRNTIHFMEMDDVSLEIQHWSDLPSFTGLGTSSAFLVSLVNSLNIIKEGKIFSSNQVAQIAWGIENVLMQANAGLQDSNWAARGGVGKLYLHNGYLIEYLQYPWLRKVFEKYGLLFFTGISRKASEIIGKYIGNIASCAAQKEIVRIAEEADQEVQKSSVDIDKLGYLLNQTWEAKRKVSPFISLSKVDFLLGYLNDNNVIYGGKLCGAGGGGSLFLLAEPSNHEKIIEFMKVNDCIHIPFKISETGSEQIV